MNIEAYTDGLDIEFSEPLATPVADELEIRTWAYERSKKYGSKRLDNKRLQVTAAKLSSDRKTLKLKISGMKPVWQMSIKYQLTGSDGKDFAGEIQNTIHKVYQR